METNINNPHDHFFRHTFSQPEDARAFLKHFLPPELQALLALDELELESGSYIDEKLREHLTDILYRVPLHSGEVASIYCLFEHKSYPEAAIHLQILRYSYERWQADTQAGVPWRPIVPIVFYHGQRAWNIPLRFGACFGEMDPLIQRYMPDFEYLLIDTNRYGDEVLRDVESGPLQASLFLLKYIYDKELSTHLGEIFQPLRTLAPDELLQRLWSVVSYITSATEHVQEERLRETLTDVFREAEGVMNTIADKWLQQGIEQGIEQGREQGIEQGALQMILRLLQTRFGVEPEEVQEMIGALNVEDLSVVIDLALDASNVDDFVERLRAQLHES